MFSLEYNFDGIAKRLCEAKRYICLKPVPCNQIVASVKIKIATVESPPPVTPPPQTKKDRAGDLSRKNPVEAVIVKNNSCKLAEISPTHSPSLF